MGLFNGQSQRTEAVYNLQTRDTAINKEGRNKAGARS